MEHRRAIDAGERPDVLDERLASDLQIGSDIGEGLDPHRQEISILVEREFCVGDVVARLPVAEEGFRARADPLHRPPGELCRQQHQRHLVVDRGLHAKGAADVAADHAHPVFGHLQHGLGEVLAERERALQRRIDGIALVGRMVDADAAARLHARSGNAVDHQAMLDDMGGLDKGSIGSGLVAEKLHEADVVRAIVEDERRAGCRSVGRRDDGRQRLVIDLDQLGRIHRLVHGLGNHKRHIVADPAHAVLDQCRIARLVHRAAVAALEPPRDRQVAEARCLPIRTGEHRQHARSGLGAGRVD